MNGYSTIYTDGSSRDVSAWEADVLHKAKLVVPHPGAGADGIKACDWKLAEGVEWLDVDATLDALRAKRDASSAARFGLRRIIEETPHVVASDAAVFAVTIAQATVARMDEA